MILEIKNFQSMAEAKIDLSGFVAVVGPTNRGKSAIIRALRTILYNEWDASYLRLGTTQCIISITFSESEGGSVAKVLLEKPLNTYRVWMRNGEERTYPKVGIDVPEEIKQLGFRILQSERDDKFNLNFQGQFDPLFLVAQSEVVITSFFNTVFKVTQFERALKNINNDSMKLNKEYEAQSVKLTSDKANLECVSNDLVLAETSEANLKEQLKLVESEYQKIMLLDNDIKIIEKAWEIQNQIEAINNNIKIFQLLIALINQIVVQVNKIQSLNQDTQRLGQIEQEYDLFKSRNIQISGVWEFLSKYNGGITQIGDLIKHSNKLYQIELSIKDNKIRFDTLDMIYLFVSKYTQQVADMGSFKYYEENLIKLEQDLKIIKSRFDTLDEIYSYLGIIVTSGEELKGVVFGVQNSIGALKVSEMVLLELKQKVETTQVITELLTQYQSLVFNTVDKCPTCGGLLGDHIHE